MLFWLSKNVDKNVCIIVRMPIYCTLIYSSHVIYTGWLIDWSFFVFNFHNSSWIGGGIVIGLISYVHDLINYSIVCCYIPYLVDSCLIFFMCVCCWVKLKWKCQWYNIRSSEWRRGRALLSHVFCMYRFSWTIGQNNFVTWVVINHFLYTLCKCICIFSHLF